MILKQCCDLLEKRELKIAFVESASSGYLCSQFSVYKNSGADILLGGLVSYDPSIKTKVLHISQTLIEQFTAESAEVTHAMAVAGQTLFTDADLVIACTGLLKPGGSATPDKPEGTFFICISYLELAYSFRYELDGSPIHRLDQLTDLVAQNIFDLLNQTVH